MQEREKKLLRYCLRKGLITKVQLRRLQQEYQRSPHKTILRLVSRQLGWDKPTLQAHLVQATHDSQASKAGESLERETLANQPGEPHEPSTLIQTDAVAKQESPSTPRDISGSFAEQLARLETKSLATPGRQASSWDPVISGAMAEDQVGSRLGPYQCVAKLGSGGMGVVYKAYHPGLQQYFAIKTLLAGHDNATQIKRFIREARVVAQLRHPHIVAVHDIAEHQGQHYIVMDYIPGRELSTLIKEGRIWPLRALELIGQIAQALAYSHAHGVIHRDIKPSNILVVQEEGREKAYLMDFGLAAVVKEEGLTLTGQIMGTPKYMSPEQARGQRHLDARSDIYSLGAVLYEMLCGKPVVTGSNVMAILHQVVHVEPIPLCKRIPNISRDVAIITHKCLAKEPDQRYQEMQTLAADMERCRRGEAILARSASPWYRCRRWCRRHWYFVVTGLVLIVLVTGIIAGSQVLKQRQLRQARLQEAQEYRRQGQLGLAGIVYRKLNESAQLESLRAELSQKIHRLCQQDKGPVDELKRAEQYWDALQKFTDSTNEVYQKCQHEIEQNIQARIQQVEQYCKQKKFQEAEELHKQLLQLKSAKDLAQLGKKIINLGTYIIKTRKKCRAQACEIYEQALQIFTNPYLQEPELQSCLDLFLKATGEDPSFAQAYFQAGRAAQRLLMVDKACGYYDESLRCNPRLVGPRYYLTTLRLPQRIADLTAHQDVGLGQALAALSQEYYKIWTSGFKNKKPTRDTCKQIWGPSLLLASKSSKKQQIYQDMARAWYLWMRIQLQLAKDSNYRDSEEYSQNTEQVEACLKPYCPLQLQPRGGQVKREAPPIFPDAYFIMAQLYSYPVKYQVQDSKKSQAQDQKMIFPKIEKGHTPKKLTKALRYCNAFIRLAPLRYEGYYLRSAIYTALGAYATAEPDLTRALEIKNVGQTLFYQDRATCYLVRGEIDKGRADLIKIIRDPHHLLDSFDRAELYGWLAISIACLGKAHKQEAEQYLQHCLANIPAGELVLSLKIVEFHHYEKLLQFCTYILIDQDIVRARQTILQFLRSNRGYIDYVIKGAHQSGLLQNFQTLLPYLSNMFCAPLPYKRQRSLAYTFSRFYHHAVGQGLNLWQLSNFYVVGATYFKILQQRKDTRRKLAKIDQIVRRQFGLYSLSLLIEFSLWLAEDVQLQRLLDFREIPLPEVGLYYQRASHYYCANQLQLACADLLAALRQEPEDMRCHYGLSTLYALLLQQAQQHHQPQRAAVYRTKALYHLKRALANGWSHWRDYTLHDSDFKALGLGQEVPISTLQRWAALWRVNQQRWQQLKEDIASLLKQKEYHLARQRVKNFAWRDRRELAPLLARIRHAQSQDK